jgi:hypothetical protein
MDVDLGPDDGAAPGLRQRKSGNQMVTCPRKVSDQTMNRP